MKGSVLLATFIFLTICFRCGHERCPVEASVVLEVVKQTEVNINKDEYDHKKDDEGTFVKRAVLVPPEPEDENGKYIGQYDPGCNEAILITPTKQANLELDPKKLKYGGTTCHWTIIREEDCIPSLSCTKFHLMDPTPDNEEPCQGEYLGITDGSFGYQKFCGKEGPDIITSGRRFRDFYITLILANIKKSRGFKCTVTCSPGRVHGNILDEPRNPEGNDYCTCGRIPTADKIEGGEDSKRNVFPWMAALVANGTNKPFCGASIINNQIILTAANCFKEPYVKAKNIQILINAHKMEVADSKAASGQNGSHGVDTPEQLAAKYKNDNSHRFNVDRYFIHPLYFKETNDFDVALIKLDKPIDFSKIKEVAPVCLPQANRYNESREGAKAVITGWGLTSSNANTTESILQKVDLPVLANEECKGFYGERYTRRMMCAAYKEGGQDSCKGDPGGP